MNSTFKREQRYLVIKVKDAKYYLDKDQLEQLAGIADTIEVRRKAVGLPGLECVVIESHWPEYEATWKAIEARVTGAQPAPSVPDATWLPVPDKHPTFDPVDLQLADGSVLCGCVPQSDGDYWWEGPSGEVFIDPRYAPITHWRLSAAPEAKP